VVKYALFGLLALSLLQSPVAAKRAARHTTGWLVPGNDPPESQASKTHGDYYTIGRIVPAKLFRLEQDAAVLHKGITVIAIPRATLMVPLEDDSHSACTLRTLAGSAFACLSDTDGDGAYDTFFGTQVFNEIFFGSIGDDGGFSPLVQRVNLLAVDPKVETPKIDIAVKPKSIVKSKLIYTVCVFISWESRYYDRPICSVNNQQSPLNSDGIVTIYGQNLIFPDPGNSPKKFNVEHGKVDFNFQPDWRFP